MNKFKNIALFMLLSSSCFASDVKTKASFLVGGTSYKEVDDYKGFGNAYLEANASMTSNYLTVGSKIYYRLKVEEESEDLQEKLELKRAYVYFRPFGDSRLEIGGGRLYSWYLPGNFFNLAEIYTGSSRWGKTGVAIRSEIKGFSFGLSRPLTESYVKYAYDGTSASDFAVNVMLGYDFSYLNKNIPLKLSSAYFYDRSHAKYDKKNPDLDYEDDFKYCVSAYYTPKLNFKPTFCLTYSYNSEPYVASSVFKNIDNYGDADLGECHLISLNTKMQFGKTQIMLESEEGHSMTGHKLPIYDGLQVYYPINSWLGLKPRFFYYASIDTEDSDLSRQTFHFYPRLWFTLGKWNMSCGSNMYYKELDTRWSFNWDLPWYVEYKL